MAKDSYNIDDILSEVKKRRIENEEKIKANDQKADEITDNSIFNKNENLDKNIDSILKEKEEKKIANKVEKIKTNEVDNLPKEELPKVEIKTQKDEIIDDTKIANDVDKAIDHSTNFNQISENDYKKSNEIENNHSKEEFGDSSITDEEAFEDVTKYAKKYDLGDISTAEYEEVDQEALGKTRKSKTKKIVLIIVAILAVIGIICAVYVNNMLNKISSHEQRPEYKIQLEEKVNEFPTIEETDASKISSFKDMIMQWYYNGEPAKSSDVLNIMLIGEDVNESNRGDAEILESGVRADSVIIVSVNRQTKQISLTSVLRDTYSFFEVEPGNKKTGKFSKINGAMSVGNVHTYINAVERLYKININNYVIVNFESFKSIIDALGGVNLEITETEINHVNSNSDKYYGGVKIKKKFEGSKGVQKLNGIEALTYCRIRHLDSDNMRANRQKACLIQIFNQLKDSSKVQLANVATKLLPYVKAGLTKNEILDLISVALSEGWLQYEIRLNTVPSYRINEKGAGGSYYGAWCWKSDFPQDAYDLQYYIYGRTNILLAKTRVDVINCKEEGFFDKGSSPVKAVIENKHYGELSTFERPDYVGINKPEAQPSVKITEKTTEKPSEKTTNKPTQKPTEKQTEKQKTTEKPSDNPKPTQQSTQKPSEKPSENTNEKPNDKPNENKEDVAQ